MLRSAARLGLLALLAATAARGLELPALFADRMVLQRDIRLPIWGTAEAGSGVTVTVAGQRHRTTAEADGGWKLHLDPLAAGGPHQLVVTSGDEQNRFADVLVGEVWLASGQSNMEMPLAGWGRVLDYELEIARADYPQIRLFQVERQTAVRPAGDVEADGWKSCTAETVPLFSATAYFFGRRLHRELGVPIGLIHSSWGGTAAEAWTSASTLETLPEFRETTRAVRSLSAEDLAAMAQSFDEAMAERRDAMASEDTGLVDGEPIWARRELEDSTWPTMELPSKWEDAGELELDGVVWFRRTIEVPPSWAGTALELGLGRIDDGDETFFNGVRVGATAGWDVPRNYRIPAALVRPGDNTIAVRVLDDWQSGGLWGEPADLRLTGSSEPAIALAGAWRYRIGFDSRERDPLPPYPGSPHWPSVLYNGMIRPLAPYAIRGVIWYQGESNTGRAHQYRRLFRALIRDWRATWKRPRLPFYFVQLASFLEEVSEPGESAWAELREAQLLALDLPATGMAVATDIGNALDVHPKNKQEVGNRLARLALRRLYGRQVADSGPVLREMRPEGRRLRLVFDHTAGGLEAKQGALEGFAVAGEDRLFRWAQAAIEGDSVVVWSDEVEAPLAARYGWAANPRANLFNAAGLPASPFRTDDWSGVTVDAETPDWRE